MASIPTTIIKDAAIGIGWPNGIAFQLSLPSI
jgi:hypothetical protein